MGVLDRFRLDGRAAIVTGAARGIGQAAATGLAEAGADVLLVGRSDLGETKARIEKLGRRALALRADLQEMKSIPKVVDAALEAFGKVDILVNNSGIVRRAAAIEHSEKDWDEVLNLNTKIPFFLCQAVARDMMKRKKGKIINVASITCFWGATRIPAYAASKAGIAQFTKSLCNEWAKDGLHVNALAPGYMATDINKDLRADAAKSAELLSRIPMGRYGDVEELQGIIVFMASDASSYMNGTTVFVDGGWLAR